MKERKERKKAKMFIIIGTLLVIICAAAVFFSISYSKIRAEFAGLKSSLLSQANTASGMFTEEDIAELPLPVQRYFRYCGFIGTPKMSSMKIIYKDADFRFGKDKPTIKIDYTQYNFVDVPDRIVYIDSSIYGLPFEGLDSFIAGHGSMKGVLAKLFTLFNQTGEEMDKACLVTCLSECLLVPSAALQDYVSWEEIDNLHAKAAISCYGITASGVFTFKENGEMVSFTTDDRANIGTDGTSEKVKWSAVCEDYAATDGIKKPTALKAVWHYDDGDLVYFEGQEVIIEYNPHD